jgi:ferredoxin
VYVFIAWQLASILNNIAGHLGHEVYPHWWSSHKLLKYKTTGTHHNMHHEKFNGNYGLFFTWWDVWMGIEFADYKTTHQQVFLPVATVPIITQNNLPQNSTVQIKLNSGIYQLKNALHTPILQSAIAENIPVKYACKAGRCGLCKIKCAVGKFNTAVTKGITQPEIDAGLILLCSSRLQTNHAVLIPAT